MAAPSSNNFSNQFNANFDLTDFDVDGLFDSEPAQNFDDGLPIDDRESFPFPYYSPKKNASKFFRLTLS